MQQRCKARNIVKAADKALEVIERHVRVGCTGEHRKEERQDLGACLLSETGPQVFEVLQRLGLIHYPQMR